MPFIIESAPEPVIEAVLQPELATADVTVPAVLTIEQEFTAALTACSSAPSTEVRQKTLVGLHEKVRAMGPHAALSAPVLEILRQSAVDKRSTGARETVFLALSSFASLGQIALPYLVSFIPCIGEGLGDKQKSVAKAAKVSFDSIMLLVNESLPTLKIVLPLLLTSIRSEVTSWQAKVVFLGAIHALTKTAPAWMDRALPEIIPVVSHTIWDSKPEVQKAATTVLKSVCSTVTNPDLHPFIPELVRAIAEPEQVPETVYKLAATTFVTTVEAPSLAIMAPILYRGLAENSRAILRQTSVIIDNMCKLVEVPAHAEQFLPKLLPGLNRCIATAADPELRNVATRAKATLVRVGGGKEDVVIEDFAVKAKRDMENTMVVLSKLLARLSPNTASNLDMVTNMYVCTIATSLDDARDYQMTSWAKLAIFFESMMSTAVATEVCTGLRAHFQMINSKRGVKAIDTDPTEGEELCNCEFSLAYGGMILLNNTRLRLTRGQRYGLCGPNGAGKSTLMRAIANGQLDGFPTRDQLKTVFVEHNLQASDAEKAVIDFVTSDPEFAGKDVKEIKDTLASVGFDAEKQAMPVTALSGGWKMKLELARAMLMNADILLLDEPTNHLDVNNVKWLTNYLTNLPNVTSIIVSHDSGFLDDVCSHIIHYEHMKLKTYKGNLSELVKIKPEAKSYYTLASTAFSFKFPEPGFLEGIKSKDRAIIKLMRVGFQYPNTTKTTVSGVTLQCALSSRVAVIGPNGAGKSTVIKVLTGEVEPTEGETWKHPTLRVAYVAQHAFHHVEQHMDKTPNEYIRWRFQTGEDRELASKITRQLTPEEEAKLQIPIVIEGEKRKIETFMGRRTSKRSFEYEIKWQGKSWDDNTWMSREKLEDMGLQKFLKIYDDKEAAREGLYQRPLTSVNVEKHLQDIGLAPEWASHSRIRGLSGGQKVKVVIGAAMWNNPHLLVLDEPTNYLDRDSLGALAGAIKEFGGGVVMVSHHSEFTNELCTETWELNNGQLTVIGAEVPQIIEKIEQKETLTSVDAYGNTVKAKSTRTLSRKERLQKEKRKAMKIKNGEPLSSDEEDD